MFIRHALSIVKLTLEYHDILRIGERGSSFASHRAVTDSALHERAQTWTPQRVGSQSNHWMAHDDGNAGAVRFLTERAAWREKTKGLGSV